MADGGASDGSDDEAPPLPDEPPPLPEGLPPLPDGLPAVEAHDISMIFIYHIFCMISL